MSEWREASQFRNSGAVAQEFGNCSEKKEKGERNELSHSSNGLPPPASKPAGIGRGCGHSPRGATNNAGQGWLLWHHTPPFSSGSGEGLAARGRNGQWGERGPNENLPLGTSVFREFFSNLTEVLIFFKMSKKRSNYESSVYLRIYVGEKKDLFWFLAIFDKNTGHRVTKIYPVSRISITYKSYLINFFLSRKKYFDFFLYTLF